MRRAQASRPPGRPAPPGQRGVALVLVLWVVSLLAVIAGNFAFGMRGELQTTRNQLLAARARALADAGAQRAFLELLKPGTDPMRWRADGVARAFGLDGVAVRVVIVPETAKIDLNAAPDALLLGLFRSAGLGEAESAALLDAVVDWRDADSLRRPQGAEADDYRAAGRSDGPANAPFETLEELQQVMGMTPALFRQLAPALTVHSRQPGIAAAAAPAQVLRALPGVSAEQVEQYLRQRDAAVAAGQDAPPFAAGGVFVMPLTAGQATYTVRSEVQLPEGAAFTRQATVRLLRGAAQPVAVLAWGEGQGGVPMNETAGP